MKCERCTTDFTGAYCPDCAMPPIDKALLMLRRLGYDVERGRGAKDHYLVVRGRPNREVVWIVPTLRAYGATEIQTAGTYLVVSFANAGVREAEPQTLLAVADYDIAPPDVERLLHDAKAVLALIDQLKRQFMYTVEQLTTAVHNLTAQVNACIDFVKKVQAQVASGGIPAEVGAELEADIAKLASLQPAAPVGVVAGGGSTAPVPTPTDSTGAPVTSTTQADPSTLPPHQQPGNTAANG